MVEFESGKMENDSDSYVRGRIMVLIVEDEAISRRALQQLLCRSGLETKAAGSGEEAIKMVSQDGLPNIAIVDINLPGMNGLEFVRKLHQLHSTLPCIFMTANDEAHDDQIREGGSEPMFRKPFDVSGLLQVVFKTVGVSKVQ